MAEGGSGAKPSDFFVGLVDFFAILLPGAMLAFVLVMCLERLGTPLTSISLSNDWVTLFAVWLVSYVLGHFLSVVAALCLDPPYDWWKDTLLVWKKDNRLHSAFYALGNGLRERRELQDKATETLEEGEGLADVAAYVRVWSDGATSEVDRLEADQKFFRSLTLVFLIAWLAFVWNWEHSSRVWAWSGLVLLLVPMFPFRIFGTTETDNAADKAEKFAALKLVALVLLVAGWTAWFAATQSSPSWLPAAGLAKRETDALSVTASLGSVFVTAKAEGKTVADVTWTLVRDYPNGLKTAVIFGLVLSLVRFVQLRLKYSKFLYRAYLALKKKETDRVPSNFTWF
jgi:hypothetical protein